MKVVKIFASFLYLGKCLYAREAVPLRHFSEKAGTKKLLLTILLTSIIALPTMASYEPFGNANASQGMVYTTSTGIMHSGSMTSSRRSGAFGGGSGLFSSNSAMNSGSMSFSASNTSYANRGNLSVVSIHNEVCQNLNINEVGSMPTGPRRIKEDDIKVPPIGVEDPASPVGDALLPLLLLVAMYGIWTLRKRKVQK